MPAARPREAAAVILLRDGTPFEVLMIERNPAGRVMGGVWAFPGGAVDEVDGDGECRLRLAAVRELAEETAITGVDPGELVPFAQWVAPVSLPVRYDAHFFLARAPEGQEPVADGVECVDARWFTAAGALDGGELALLFPTRKQLERLRAFTAVEELLSAADAAPVSTMRPRLRFAGDQADPLLPGDPGYETASG
jgi:8-oxo-dGTP pyrophosphatase MutT (NUDIX family)